MDAARRRKKITEILRQAGRPVTGNELAALLDVTRQVVVQDMALLRAGGSPFIATSSGYMMLDAVAVNRPVKVFTCRHESLAQAEAELMMIVESGGRIRDIIIEHPVYGEITGTIMVKTPEAVKSLIARLGRKDAQMLSSITDGIHMHTVDADSEEILTEIEMKLRQAGILL